MTPQTFNFALDRLKPPDVRLQPFLDDFLNDIAAREASFSRLRHTALSSFTGAKAFRSLRFNHVRGNRSDQSEKRITATEFYDKLIRAGRREKGKPALFLLEADADIGKLDLAFAFAEYLSMVTAPWRRDREDQVVLPVFIRTTLPGEPPNVELTRKCDELEKKLSKNTDPLLLWLDSVHWEGRKSGFKGPRNEIHPLKAFLTPSFDHTALLNQSRVYVVPCRPASANKLWTDARMRSRFSISRFELQPLNAGERAIFVEAWKANAPSEDVRKNIDRFYPKTEEHLQSRPMLSDPMVIGSPVLFEQILEFVARKQALPDNAAQLLEYITRGLFASEGISSTEARQKVYRGVLEHLIFEEVHPGYPHTSHSDYPVAPLLEIRDGKLLHHHHTIVTAWACAEAIRTTEGSKKKKKLNEHVEKVRKSAGDYSYKNGRMWTLVHEFLNRTDSKSSGAPNTDVATKRRIGNKIFDWRSDEDKIFRESVGLLVRFMCHGDAESWARFKRLTQGLDELNREKEGTSFDAIMIHAGLREDIRTRLPELYLENYRNSSTSKLILDELNSEKGELENIHLKLERLYGYRAYPNKKGAKQLFESTNTFINNNINISQDLHIRVQETPIIDYEKRLIVRLKKIGCSWANIFQDSQENEGGNKSDKGEKIEPLSLSELLFMDNLYAEYFHDVYELSDTGEEMSGKSLPDFRASSAAPQSSLSEALRALTRVAFAASPPDDNADKKMIASSLFPSGAIVDELTEILTLLEVTIVDRDAEEGKEQKGSETVLEIRRRQIHCFALCPPDVAEGLFEDNVDRISNLMFKEARVEEDNEPELSEYILFGEDDDKSNRVQRELDWSTLRVFMYAAAFIDDEKWMKGLICFMAHIYDKYGLEQRIVASGIPLACEFVGSRKPTFRVVAEGRLKEESDLEFREQVIKHIPSLDVPEAEHSCSKKLCNVPELHDNMFRKLANENWWLRFPRELLPISRFWYWLCHWGIKRRFATSFALLFVLFLLHEAWVTIQAWFPEQFGWDGGKFSAFLLLLTAFVLCTFLILQGRYERNK